MSQPVVAGVAGVVTALVADQVALGHDVHVACPAGPDLAAVVSDSGATHHRWAAVRNPGTCILRETRDLHRIVESVQPDVLVLHSAKAGLAGRLAAHGTPTVYVPHAWSFEAVTGPIAVATRAWEILAGRRTDLTVCVSADEVRAGRAAGAGGPMRVIRNGIDVEQHRPMDRVQARRRLGLADVPTVVCVGRLARQKGQDLLLQAWAAVHAAVPDAVLVLVGDGPLRATLEAAAGPDVHFVGNQSDVDSYLAAATVVAMPSRWEAASLVALEAMACARPVVAFEVGGVREALGDTGRIIATDDVAAFAAALIELLGDPEAADLEGSAARDRVVSTADIRTTLDTWNDTLEELLVTGAEDTTTTPARLRVDDVTSVVRQWAGGVVRDTDVARLSGDRSLDPARAAALSAAGVPVWWADDTGPGVPALGAPIVAGAQPEADALATAARRPGTPRPEAAGPAPHVGVSVVVTMLNEGPALQRLVDAVVAQLSPGDELVLVDGGSTDGSIESLRADPAVRVLVQPGAGISAGRNIGIRAAAHDVIVCTDVGCEPGPDFVDAFRRAFAVTDPPALVSGVYTATARGALERAQALACYPQPSEVRRPTLAVRAYTTVFGTGYDPRYAVGRCVAFTRAAWEAVGGFPEHLPTGEDVSFGLAVAEHGPVRASTDALVAWHQRDGLKATWRMYRSYGRSSTDGGDPRLLLRDGPRALAYVVGPVLLADRRTRPLALAGAAAYLSLPLARVVRERAGLGTASLLPVALATKDLGKVAGAAQGLWRRWRRR